MPLIAKYCDFFHCLWVQTDKLRAEWDARVEEERLARVAQQELRLKSAQDELIDAQKQYDVANNILQKAFG